MVGTRKRIEDIHNKLVALDTLITNNKGKSIFFDDFYGIQLKDFWEISNSGGAGASNFTIYSSAGADHDKEKGGGAEGTTGSDNVGLNVQLNTGLAASLFQFNIDRLPIMECCIQVQLLVEGFVTVGYYKDANNYLLFNFKYVGAGGNDIWIQAMNGGFLTEVNVGQVWDNNTKRWFKIVIDLITHDAIFYWKAYPTDTWEVLGTITFPDLPLCNMCWQYYAENVTMAAIQPWIDYIKIIQDREDQF